MSGAQSVSRYVCMEQRKIAAIQKELRSLLINFKMNGSHKNTEWLADRI